MLPTIVFFLALVMSNLSLQDLITAYKQAEKVEPIIEKFIFVETIITSLLWSWLFWLLH